MTREQLEHAIRAVAYRPKDRDFVRVLLAEELVDDGILRERVRLLPGARNRRHGLIKWIERTVGEL